MAFTSLNHYLDVEWMEYAYECTRKDGAVGVDGQTAEEYAVDLRHNLTDLIDRLKSGRYRAPPLRRHYIDKAGGGKRGLAIPSFEDKVAQRAIVMLLEPIFEQDFLDCSIGYRPGRNAHQALQVLRSGIMERRGYWVLEVDIRRYFDSLPRTTLRDSIARRVTDGVVRRLIDKWLHAGVLESGQVRYPDAGTPQGSVISPILSNVVLHHVIDEWFTHQVQPRLRGSSTLVRFCDDFVMLLTHRDDAERVLAVLGKRLGKFGLQLHPDKTRLVDFRPRRGPSNSGESALPTSFNFLGFCHVWGTSRKGNTVVRQVTAKDRLARSLKAFNQQCRLMRHWPLDMQHERLCQMLKGHYGYFGISGNIRRLGRVCFACSGCGACGYRGDRGRAPCPGRGIRGCSSASRCLNLGSSIATPWRERTCAMTNRMRELRSCGSVRAEDSNVLGYSDVSRVRFRPWATNPAPFFRALRFA
jgi:group II intron reverse transcriptase/maturase